jgi:hypothetical protein
MDPQGFKDIPENRIAEALFEDAEYFLKAARYYERKNQKRARTYVRASVITAFAALESLVNFYCFWIAEHGDVEPHEEAFLREKRFELAKEGYFEMRTSRFSSLEQKVRFLHWWSKNIPIPKRSAAWSAFIEATKLRNSLVHPRPGHISYSGQTVTAAKSCLIAVFKVAQMFGWPAQEIH